MTGSHTRTVLLRGFAWGALGGAALVALMYLAGPFLGLRALPQLLSGPFLSLMPGFVFGFLIDTLQHAGKVIEEAGLIVAMIAALGVLGAVWAVANQRWRATYAALAFAGFGWLVVVAVILPLTGAGFLGLSDGLATPLIWAALFAVYGVVLQMGFDGGGAADPTRRRLLSVVPVSIGAVSVGLLAVRLGPDWYRAIFNPPESGLKGPSPEVTPVENFYVVSKNFNDPVVDAQGWSLSIGGLVDHPQGLTLLDLRALPSATELVTLECISNNVGGDLMSTGEFRGVRLKELLATAGPQAGGTWAAFRARDGYAESLPMSVIESSPEILVAYELNGAPLPSSHGFPARILIPGRYGMKGPKWLESIQLVDHESGGYWEQQGWDPSAFVKTTARFDVPVDGEIKKLGVIAVSGVAFAGTRGISKVEYSTNGGQSWTDATIKPPVSKFTWVLWHADWSPASEGSYQLMVRATDGQGATQESKDAASYPSGASGYHRIRVNVSRP